jgi:hypothetical protein
MYEYVVAPDPFKILINVLRSSSELRRIKNLFIACRRLNTTTIIIVRIVERKDL